MNAVDTNVLIYALDADEPVKQTLHHRFVVLSNVHLSLVAMIRYVGYTVETADMMVVRE